MRTKRVLRYYCEHCKKSGCSKHWMTRHEDSCIHNPKRICRFHYHIDESEDEKVQSLPYLIAHVMRGSLNALREASMGCPACMLAAIVQSGITKQIPDEEGFGKPNEFSAWRYKDEKAEFWNDRQRIYQP